MGCASSRQGEHEFFKVDDRVMAIKRQHIRQIRNPHTGNMEDTLYGAKWSPGVVTAVKEIQIRAAKSYNEVSGFYWPQPGDRLYTRTGRRRAGNLIKANKPCRGRKYIVTFDTGDCEVNVPIDRLRGA